MAESAYCVESGTTRGAQRFVRRTSYGPSMVTRLTGKPAKKCLRLAGMLALFVVGGVFLVPAEEDRAPWRLEDPPGRRLEDLLADKDPYVDDPTCTVDPSEAALGYPSCHQCMVGIIPEENEKEVLLGAMCKCHNDKTCARKDVQKDVSADNACEFDEDGYCKKALKIYCARTTFPAKGEMVPLYLLIILYCFLGLAIVCDELFVPALEIMAEKMELSNDVAGATLMAAGGSAPELATSLYGTFAGSDVGMGTIVGSAVFNVLFVIGMCAMATPAQHAPLRLTWWPLARDCTYYLITLIALAIWFKVTSPGVIEAWEAAVQLLLYFGYVFLMKNSEALEAYVKGKLNKGETAQVAPAEGEAYSAEAKVTSNFDDPNADFLRPSTFRTGVYQLLTQHKSIMETAGVHVVTRIKGDVNETFEGLDKNKNGKIEKNELFALFEQLAAGGKVDAEEVDKVYKQLDVNGDGTVSKEEFIMWYTGSETRIRDDIAKIFKELDTNGSGTITKDELQQMLNKLGHHPSADSLASIEAEINQTEGEINLGDFQAWYEHSLFWTEAKAAAEDAEESEKGMYVSVMEGIADLGNKETPLGSKLMFAFTLPISLAFAFTVPDCRPPGREGRCWAGFFMSIVWIGLFTYPMVECATALGAVFRIPVVIMGLTFLAAGTSVPDMLSSIVVAKDGKGDMAVSSSIGSNIFDVAVGLPLPWLIFSLATAADGCAVCVGTGGIVGSLMILIVMVFFVIVSIAGSGWKMSHGLGYAFFAMYFVFCLQDILRTYVPALGGDPESIPEPCS